MTLDNSLLCLEPLKPIIPLPGSIWLLFQSYFQAYLLRPRKHAISISIANRHNSKFMTSNHRQILCSAVQSPYVPLNSHPQPKFLNGDSKSLPLSLWTFRRNHQQMGTHSIACPSIQLQTYLHLYPSCPPSNSSRECSTTYAWLLWIPTFLTSSDVLV